jgi:hypothetical protein
MTNKEAREAWKKLYSEIDKDNWLFVGTINPEMVALAIKAIRIVDIIEACFKRDSNLMMDYDDWADVKEEAENE